MSEILHREVELPCSVDEAWAHVTNPSWLGEDGTLDVTPGGEGWVSDGDTTHFVLVEEVDEAERFVYRWASFDDEPTRVEITLEPSETGTRISISESPLAARLLATMAA